MNRFACWLPLFVLYLNVPAAEAKGPTKQGGPVQGNAGQFQKQGQFQNQGQFQKTGQFQNQGQFPKQGQVFQKPGPVFQNQGNNGLQNKVQVMDKVKINDKIKINDKVLGNDKIKIPDQVKIGDKIKDKIDPKLPKDPPGPKDKVDNAKKGPKDPKQDPKIDAQKKMNWGNYQAKFTHKTPLKFHTFCKGFNYGGWSNYCWFPRWNCCGYWCPYETCWYYWYPPYQCYLPVSYITVYVPGQPPPVVQAGVSVQTAAAPTPPLPSGAQALPANFNPTPMGLPSLDE